ncbi:unnamed protein product, partial [Closterium sp. Naga37s-1]
AFLEDCQKAWGKTFPGWARGATCDTISGVSCNALGMITKMTLTDNSLKGSIPNRISELSQLTLLDLSNNSLTGSIPSGIYLLPQLSYL